jgi:glycosyltransferase involved in cell wall biosynthesis
MQLSVVIICKNEETFIGGCIQSVLKSVPPAMVCEILLVDSASTDRTVAIAQQYPVTIYQLRPEWRHTPAAGRHVGFHKSSGEYVLFCDGDSFLAEGFIEQACASFEKEERLAGIVGRRAEAYYDGTDCLGQTKDAKGVGDRPKEIFTSGGNAMYRRSALAAVGGFNPYLFSEEEAELSDRLRRAGFRMLAIPCDMVVHNTVRQDEIPNIFARMRKNFLVGAGQIVRQRLLRGMSIELLRIIVPKLRLLAWIGIGVGAAAASIVSWDPRPVMAWAVLWAVLIVFWALKAGSITKPLRYSLIWGVESLSIVRGFLLKPLAPESYPTDVIVIQRAAMDRGCNQICAEEFHGEKVL